MKHERLLQYISDHEDDPCDREYITGLFDAAEKDGEEWAFEWIRKQNRRCAWELFFVISGFIAWCELLFIFGGG